MYLRAIGNSFGFVNKKENAEDVEISNEFYNKFFELQSQGKQLRIKNINGIVFEEIFEEYIPEPQPQVKTELQILKETVDTLVLSMLGGL